MSDLGIAFQTVPLPSDPPISLTLTVGRHSCVSIIGDENSGVDHIGQLALCLRPAGGGGIRTLDTDPGELSRRALLAFRRRVGYLPAGDGLMQNLSLRENIALPLRFGSELSERDIEGRLDIMTAAARISGCADLRPSQASHEQRRRSGVARALAFDPELVILEKPFTGLITRTALELLELARGGDVAEGSRRAVLVLGHDLPTTVKPRFEHRYRITRGELRQED